jgi:hypothetical protein
MRSWSGDDPNSEGPNNRRGKYIEAHLSPKEECKTRVAQLDSQPGWDE